MNDDNQHKAQQLNELKERRQKLQMMGGSDRVAAQNKRGKLTARQRIDMLLDEGSFQETGIFVKSRGASSYGDVPADAVVTGLGKIDGRKICIYAQDFTSMGGTMSEMQGR
ncbi:MAG TPA: methylmalonyl-CoA carboxyltransferase, partial [Dehalococcoidia bacterium]|nr:methylmalonyl-CoA carboxyltransferase [Dehalococcoidia bacterium]